MGKLPIPFFGYVCTSIRGVASPMDSLQGINCSTDRMSGNMRGCHRLACGTGCRAGGIIFPHFTGGRMGIKGSLADNSHVNMLAPTASHRLAACSLCTRCSPTSMLTAMYLTSRSRVTTSQIDWGDTSNLKHPRGYPCSKRFDSGSGAMVFRIFFLKIGQNAHDTTNCPDC